MCFLLVLWTFVPILQHSPPPVNRKPSPPHITASNWDLSFSFAPHPKPPLCKGRWAKSLISLGGVVNPSVKTGSEEPVLTAPFTQGSLGALPRHSNCTANCNLKAAGVCISVPLYFYLPRFCRFVSKCFVIYRFYHFLVVFRRTIVSVLSCKKLRFMLCLFCRWTARSSPSTGGETILRQERTLWSIVQMY